MKLDQGKVSLLQERNHSLFFIPAAFSFSFIIRWDNILYTARIFILYVCSEMDIYIYIFNVQENKLLNVFFLCFCLAEEHVQLSTTRGLSSAHCARQRPL